MKPDPLHFGWERKRYQILTSVVHIYFVVWLWFSFTDIRTVWYNIYREHEDTCGLETEHHFIKKKSPQKNGKKRLNVALDMNKL